MPVFINSYSSLTEPLLFIIFCAGCLAVEEYVLHLTQLFRLNGIHAVSELTEENEIRNLGHGVYLNKMLDQSDYILLLCTNGKEKSIHLWILNNLKTGTYINRKVYVNGSVY